MSKFGKVIVHLRFKFFMSRRNRQIQDIFAHLDGRRDYGYPFTTRGQMNQITDALDLLALLTLIEQQSPEMGEAYGDTFCYVLRQDIHERQSTQGKNLISYLSPVTSKPATRGRIKTSHSEVLKSYQVS